MSRRRKAKPIVPAEVMRKIGKAKFGGHDLPAIISDLVHVNETAWDGTPQLENFTDHGPGHSRRILRLLQNLNSVLPRDSKFSGFEWFLLSAAALVHDLGMQWHSILERYPPGGGAPAAESWDETRMRHVDRSCTILRDLAIGNSPVTDVCPRLKFFGLDRVKARFDPLPPINVLIASHSRNSQGHEEGWRNALEWADPRPSDRELRYRMRLLAALFRLADELDVNSDRVPNFGRLFADAVPSASLLHWAACYFVANLHFEKRGPSVRIIVDKARLPCDESLEEVALFLVTNLIFDKVRTAFYKPLAPRTPSIQQILLEHGLVLLLEEPEQIGGRVSIGLAKESHKFLEGVKKYLASNGFFGSVPFRSYRLCGTDANPETKPPDTRPGVRSVRVVDELSFIRVPEYLKKGFARTENLQADEALAFLRNGIGNGTRRLQVFTETGRERELPCSGVIAAAAHLNEPSVCFEIGKNKFSVDKTDGVYEYAFPLLRSAFSEERKGGPILEMVKTNSRWWRIRLQHEEERAVEVFVVGLRGRKHCVIWTPLNDLCPRIKNFFDAVGASSRRSVWLRRASFLERLAGFFEKVLGPGVSTVTILDRGFPFRAFIYSAASERCVSFSGTALAVAGCFVLDHQELIAKDGYGIHTFGPNEARLSAWYQPTELFRVNRKGKKVWLQTKAVLDFEGRIHRSY